MRMTGENTTAANYGSLSDVQNKFNDLAAALGNSTTPLGQHHDKAIAGAGQFSAHLQPGAVKFLLSWREVFDVCRTSAGLIAGNIGKTAVDLKAVDIDQRVDITL
jgi:hypothetical protein